MRAIIIMGLATITYIYMTSKIKSAKAFIHNNYLNFPQLPIKPDMFRHISNLHSVGNVPTIPKIPKTVIS